MISDRDYMRSPPSRKPSWLENWSVLHTLITLNVMVFLAQLYGGIPLGSGGVSLQSLRAGHVWTPFTYMFVHAHPMHLAMNLLTIGFVGSHVLKLLGSRRFLLIYFVSGLVGAAAELAVNGLRGYTNLPIVGASACAFGLLFAYACVLPNQAITMMIYFILPVNLRLRTLAIILLSMETVLGVAALLWQETAESWKFGGIAYFAHIGGALTGWYLVRLLGYGDNPMTYERLWRQQALAGSPAPSPKKLRVSAATRRLRDATPEMDEEANRRQRTSRKANPDLSMAAEVDAVLDKISVHGMASLTDDERRLLEMASRAIAERDRKGKGDVQL